MTRPEPRDEFAELFAVVAAITPAPSPRARLNAWTKRDRPRLTPRQARVNLLCDLTNWSLAHRHGASMSWDMRDWPWDSAVAGCVLDDVEAVIRDAVRREVA